ncbi:MAG: caspase family protein, partial [Treponema sp.]|nr:caspase family protein [Treponema sp.]
MQNIKFNINGLKLRAAIAAIVFLFVSFTASADDTVTRRFGVFIGSNNGGKDRPMLRYAVSDARSVSHVFGGMGGVTAEDNVLMVEPTIKEINSRLDSLKKIAAQSRQNNQRTELIFYYSGHSDEEGLLLNREHYGYRELRDYINTVSTDMTIVILDSCSSGAITRAKGGFKTQPFLFDSSVSAEGYAFLTSSSADEASQESDTIESSYFTHSLLAGLRGAADSVGDGRVTLNELYRYAYTETLARTETSVYGAQHPSYDIQISGTGDVVLTDIKEISAALVLGEDLSGRISIRDSSDFLVAELTKVSSKPLALGLEPGLYRIMVQKDDNFYRTEIRLPENQTITLGMKDFTLIASASGDRIRGNETEINPALNDNSPVYPFNIQILPGIDIFGHGSEKATNYILTGLLVVFGNNIRGIGAAGIGLINTGYVQGLQASGVFNFANGSVQGLQTAGIFNYSGSYVQGIQSSGLFN